MTGGLVLLATGGTGGHVFPAQALAEDLGRRGWRLALLTDDRGASYSGVLGALETHRINAAGVSGKGLLARVKAVVKLGLGYLQARRMIAELDPSVVVGFGGYPSVPTMLAAASLKRRTVIHEQNAVLGRANRLLASRMNTIALSFVHTTALKAGDKARGVVTGNPIRPEIAALSDAAYAPPQEGTPFRIVCVGGSQGAKVFGEIVPDAIALLPEARRAGLELALQVRPDQVEPVRARLTALGVTADIRPFFDTMPELLRAAHLVIGRAGASTTAELAAAGRPSILVPYPHAIDDHQSANAARLCDAGGAWMMPQNDLTPETLAQRLGELMDSPRSLVRVAEAARRVGIPDASRKLADLVETVARGGAAMDGDATP